MSRTTKLAAIVAAASLIAAAPAAASTGKSDVKAHAAGDPVTVMPSLIQTRLTRIDNAVGRLTDYVDDGDAVGVDRTGKVIRRQLSAAMRGAIYYIKNPPPPVADDAQESDDAPVVADPPTAAFAVFSSYHSVAATIGQLVDGARVPVLDSMNKTLFWTLNARDRAITSVHALEPPVDPEGEEGEEGEGATIATVMPGNIALLDDEIQQIKGLQSDATDLTPGGAKALTQALAQTDGDRSLDQHDLAARHRRLIDRSSRRVGMIPDNVLLVAGAPVDPARLARVLYGPVRAAETIVLAVAALDDPLQEIERALRTFAATRIVLAGTDAGADLTGAVEDRFGRPVVAVLSAGSSLTCLLNHSANPWPAPAMTGSSCAAIAAATGARVQR